jgi:hypothetical protein
MGKYMKKMIEITKQSQADKTAIRELILRRQTTNYEFVYDIG